MTYSISNCTLSDVSISLFEAIVRLSLIKSYSIPWLPAFSSVTAHIFTLYVPNLITHNSTAAGCTRQIAMVEKATSLKILI